MVSLFRQVCKPIATPATRGAFLFGYRLMGIDGTVDNVSDSAKNTRAFGRQKGSRGDSAFPQLRNVHLVELGTRVICDAIVRGYQYHERTAAYRLLRSVNKDMLVMWDCGFHSFKMVRLSIEKGAKFLGRLPRHTKFERFKILSDGSYLSEIYPSYHDRKAKRNGIRVRIIEYTIDDESRTGHAEKHMLITNLLDEKIALAKKIAAEYHQRWETEIAFDEMGTHQKVNNRPMRSEKPEGVIQEAYGALIAHYIVRYLIHEVAVKEGIDPDRISFIDSLRVIRRKIDKFQIAKEEQLEPLYQMMLEDIAENKLPPRDNRINPREVKRKTSKFPSGRGTPRGRPQSRKPFSEIIYMLK